LRNRGSGDHIVPTVTIGKNDNRCPDHHIVTGTTTERLDGQQGGDNVRAAPAMDHRRVDTNNQAWSVPPGTGIWPEEGAALTTPKTQAIKVGTGRESKTALRLCRQG
jgi:hypothetical protein